MIPFDLVLTELKKVNKSMKTVFELEVLSSPINANIKIIGKRPEDKPYVKIQNICDVYQPGSFCACIKHKDLERFAINIMKVIKSKHFKP